MSQLIGLDGRPLSEGGNAFRKPQFEDFKPFTPEELAQLFMAADQTLNDLDPATGLPVPMSLPMLMPRSAFMQIAVTFQTLLEQNMKLTQRVEELTRKGEMPEEPAAPPVEG